MKLIEAKFTCTECGQVCEEFHLDSYGTSPQEDTIQALLKAIGNILRGKCVLCEYNHIQMTRIV